MGAALATLGAVLVFAGLAAAGAAAERVQRTIHSEGGGRLLAIAGLLASCGVTTCAFGVPMCNREAAEEARQDRELAARRRKVEADAEAQVIEARAGSSRARREALALKLAKRLTANGTANGAWATGPAGTWLGVALPKCSPTVLWMFSQEDRKLYGELRAAGFTRTTCQRGEETLTHDL